jgi:hypothetical protein
LANAVWLAILVFVSTPKLKVKYSKSLPKLTSRDFWKKYLELETKNDLT